MYIAIGLAHRVCLFKVYSALISLFQNLSLLSANKVDKLLNTSRQIFMKKFNGLLLFNKNEVLLNAFRMGSRSNWGIVARSEAEFNEIVDNLNEQEVRTVVQGLKTPK